MMMDTSINSLSHGGSLFGSMNFERINSNPTPGLDKYLDNMFQPSDMSSTYDHPLQLSESSMNTSKSSSPSHPHCDQSWTPQDSNEFIGSNLFSSGSGGSALKKHPAEELLVETPYKRQRRSSSSNSLTASNGSNNVSGNASVSSNDASSLDGSNCSAFGTPPQSNNPPFVDSTTVVKLLEEQSVKKRRLARKAELARVSRKKKKARMSELETEVVELKAELEKLKRQSEAQTAASAAAAAAIREAELPLVTTSSAFLACSSPISSSQRDFEAQEQKALGELERALKLDPAERKKSCDGTIERCVDCLLSASAARPNGGAKEFRALLDKLAPSLSVRFLGWILSQTDKFYQDKGGLWFTLFGREVGLAESTMEEKLLPLRTNRLVGGIRGLKEEVLAKAAAYLKCRNEFEAKAIGGLSSILTPEQMAKFFVWVKKYGEVCIKINV